MASKRKPTPDKQRGKQRKPPVGKRFAKGVSGNPAGRPKGIRTLGERLKARLESLAKDVPWAREQARELKLGDAATVAELFVDATIAAAIRGDASAFREVWDRVDGKVKQEAEVTGGGGGPLVVKVLSGVTMNDI